MNISRRCFGVVAGVLCLLGTSAFAQFSGYFSGYYAPANWTKLVSNNPLYQNTAFVNSLGAPGSLEIDGAVDSQQQISTPQPPYSIIDYTIVLSGTGLQPVAFGFLFNGAADGADAAQFIYNSVVVATLSTGIGVQHTYSGALQGGGTLDFRVYSNNDNLADMLVISAVPEPSTLTLLGLGAGALFWRLRRRVS